MNIAPARLTQLLQNDAGWIIDFIIARNFDAVADNAAVLVGNRPMNVAGVEAVLQHLLDNNNDAAFVQMLSVPLDLSDLSSEQQVAVVTSCGVGPTASDVAALLAQRALVLCKASNVAADQAAPPVTAAPGTVRAAVADVKTVVQRNRVLRYVVGGIVFILFVWVVVVVVKASNKPA